MKLNPADLEIRVNGIRLIGLGRAYISRNGVGSHPITLNSKALVLRPEYDIASDPSVIYLGPTNGLPVDNGQLHNLLTKLHSAPRHRGGNPLKKEDILVSYRIREEDGKIILPKTVEFKGFYFEQEGALLRPHYGEPTWGSGRKVYSPLVESAR